jgi:hypothetical protein
MQDLENELVEATLVFPLALGDHKDRPYIMRPPTTRSIPAVSFAEKVSANRPVKA